MRACAICISQPAAASVSRTQIAPLTMADLFHDDADWTPISPIEPRRGREAIRERYLNLVKPMSQPIINERYIADEQHCVVEFEVDHPEHGHVPIVDIFDVDAAGQITRLAVYRR